MAHRICRICNVEVLGEYRLRVVFDDGFARDIDLAPVLAGEMYGALREPREFEKVRVDPEIGTIVWPNGADFDPATLYDWPEYRDAFLRRAAEWVGVEA